MSAGDAFTFGKYQMQVEAAPYAAISSRPAEGTMVFAAPFGDDLAVPTDWSDAADLPPVEDDSSLLVDVDLDEAVRGGHGAIGPGQIE